MLSSVLGYFLAIFSATSSLPQCVPIEGADAVLDSPKLDFLIVGEMHGTQEAPSSFGELVCVASQHRRKITVALEYPVTDQGRIDAFLESDGGPDARAGLLSGPFWQTGRDGRSSHAAYRLLDRLRLMKQAGEIAGVVAIQPAFGRNNPASRYEAQMAELVLKASPEDALTIVLVGNVHAQTVRRTSGAGAGYKTMAGLLPRDRTKTLLASGNGGAAWTCRKSKSGDANGDCAIHSLNQPRKQYPRGINLINNSASRYDGYLNVGVPFSASPPAVQSQAR